MATNASQVQYTGVTLTTINALPNQTLDVILGEINTAVNTHNTAPDYSGYNLGPYHGYSITETDGTTHPTNTQNFAEGIAKIVCTDEYNLFFFINTTYANNQATLTGAINALQVPAVTFSTYSITNTMTVTQTWNALFTGLTGTINSINPSTANWSTLSISPSPTTIVGAFNDIIANISTLTSTVAGKQATLGTFNNTSNCLAGGATDSISTTVTELITYTCALPTYAAGSITTWGGITTGTTLQNSVQNVVNAVNGLFTNGVVSNGTGLTIASVGTTYQGKKLAIDTTYTQLYKGMIDSSDTTPDFIANKLVAGTGITLTIQNVSGDENILITNTVSETAQVKVNSSDTTPGYLSSKILSTNDPTWGLGLNVVASPNNSQLYLVPTVNNSSLFYQALTDFVQNNPDALSIWANITAQSQATPGAMISNLVVTLTGGAFVLTWTHQSGISQNAKWRLRGQALWNTNLFTPADPLGSTAATTTNSNVQVNVPEQFQVDTVYANGTVGSNVYEMINFACQTLTDTITTGVISVNQAAMPSVDTIQYELLNSVPAVIQTINTTGGSPAVSFTAVASGTYSVKWRYGCTLNGSLLYSDDSSQLNAFCQKTGIVVP